MDVSFDATRDRGTVRLHQVSQEEFDKWVRLTEAKIVPLPDNHCETASFNIGSVEIILFT
jgi:hypothetical protein